MAAHVPSAVSVRDSAVAAARVVLVAAAVSARDLERPLEVGHGGRGVPFVKRGVVLVGPEYTRVHSIESFGLKSVLR